MLRDDADTALVSKAGGSETWGCGLGDLVRMVEGEEVESDGEDVVETEGEMSSLVAKRKADGVTNLGETPVPRNGRVFNKCSHYNIRVQNTPLFVLLCMYNMLSIYYMHTYACTCT